MKNLLSCLAFLTQALLGTPTESREWVSTTGSKVTGSAVALDRGTVQIKLTDRTIAVPLDKLSQADRKFLTDHFGESSNGTKPAISGGSGELIAAGLGQKAGEVLGPIKAGEGSTYFLYIPKSLRKGRLAPLLHFNGSGGGSANSVKKHIEGAELNGWIVAASVESKNGPLHPVGNHAHAKRCVNHLVGTLPVDPKRVYFTGGSGGGAMTFYNSAHMKGAGGMPHIGYIPSEANVTSGNFFVISGTRDYNRYTSANAVRILGKDAIHRFFPGAHEEGPEWLCVEGMIWLNGKFLAKNKRSSAYVEEALDYEAAMIDWLRKLSTSASHRAYYWCVFLKEDYGVSGSNATAIETLAAPLRSKPECVGYAEGIEAVSDFSKRYYSEVAKGSRFAHSTPDIEKAAEKLSAGFTGVPMIEEIAEQLGQKTCAQ
jgi:hypothetical protein